MTDGLPRPSPSPPPTVVSINVVEDDNELLGERRMFDDYVTYDNSYCNRAD